MVDSKKKEAEVCFACGSTRNVLHRLCMLCSCSVPDCEHVAIHHGFCFTHLWTDPPTRLVCRPSNQPCWQCQQANPRCNGEFRNLARGVMQISRKTHMRFDQTTHSDMCRTPIGLSLKAILLRDSIPSGLVDLISNAIHNMVKNRFGETS